MLKRMRFDKPESWGSYAECLGKLVKRYWFESIRSSKSYRFAILLLFCLQFLVSLVILQSVIDDYASVYRDILIRTFLDCNLYIGLSHFILRSYLRINHIYKGFDAARITNVLVLLFGLSLVHMLGSYGIGTLDIVAGSYMPDVQFVATDGSIGGGMTSATQKLVEFIGTYISFLVWAVLYAAWHLQQNKKELQRAVNDAQIQQLSNQLSPHFLFNTLNSIRALIFADQEKAAEAVTMLSELFRTHMHSQLKVTSSVEEEVAIIDSYLGIEKLRLSDRLTYKASIDPACKNQQLPTLTLLTLVENAVKHGISPSSLPGTIEVQIAMRNAHTWTVDVSNSVHNKTEVEGTRIGLENVRKRLMLKFGHELTFTTKASKQAFSVKMELPYA